MRVWTYILYPHLTLLNLNQMDKMEVKKDVTKELTESHIDALYEAMDELMYERFEALEKYTEEQQE